MEANDLQTVQLGYVGNSISEPALLKPSDSFVGGVPKWLHSEPPPDASCRSVNPMLHLFRMTSVTWIRMQLSLM